MNLLVKILKKIISPFTTPKILSDYNEKLGIPESEYEFLKKFKLGENKLTTAMLFNQKITFNSPFWFLHSLEEIFVDEVYKFEKTNDSVKILDCGANIGLSVIYLKRLFPNAKINAFEPDAEVFEQLTENIANYNFTDVNLKNFAVWKKEEDLIFKSDGGLGGKIAEENSEEVDHTVVKALRLKDFVQEKIFFLKMDIEGAEYEVLKDIKDDLKNVENLFIEFHNNFNEENHLAEILLWIDQAGFKYYIKDAWNNMPHPFTKVYKGGYHMQLNIFCYRT